MITRKSSASLLNFEGSFIAKNLGSVYMPVMIEKIYFANMKVLVVLFALLPFLFFSACSDSGAIPESPYPLNESVPKISSSSEIALSSSEIVSSATRSWDFDSLGDYYAHEGQFTHILAQKLSLFWKYHDSIEVVCMGNSHMLVGVIPDSLKHFTVNLSTVPCDLHCVEYLYENYVSLHANELKYLVIGLDFDLWNEYETMGAIQLNFGDAAGFQYDIHHQFWRDGVDSLFVNRVVEIANEKLANEDKRYERTCANRGWQFVECKADWASGGKEYVEILVDSTAFDDGVRYESNFSELSRILEIAKKQNVVVVGVVFPISPYYRSTGSYGRHGMRRSTAEMLLQRIEKLSLESENFVLMDENKMGNHDYLGVVANDYDHLCVLGAGKLTLRLDSLLNVLDQKE